MEKIIEYLKVLVVFTVLIAFRMLFELVFNMHDDTIIMSGGGIIGGALSWIGSMKKTNQLKGQRTSLGARIAQNKQYMPLLNIDRSGMNNLVDTSKSYYEDQLAKEAYQKDANLEGIRPNFLGQGRAAGEEAMRDENRQSTADTIAQGKSSLSSGSDLLGLLGMASAQERKGSRGIDIQVAQQQAQERARGDALQEAGRGRNLNRELSTDQINAQSLARKDQMDANNFNNYNNNLLNQANFNAQADSAEFQFNDVNPWAQSVADARSLEQAIGGSRDNMWAQGAAAAQSVENKVGDVFKMIYAGGQGMQGGASASEFADQGALNEAGQLGDINNIMLDNPNNMGMMG